MKELISLIVFALMFSSFLYSQSSWEKKIVDSTMNFSGVQFLNSQTGYICGNHVSANYNSCIYKTTNSGNNWIKVSQDGGINYGIYFVDEYTGFASLYYSGFPGSGKLARTSDGGSSWQAVHWITGGSHQNLYFYNNLNGYYTGYERIVKSVDGGFNWLDISVPSTYVLKELFVDVNKGYYLSWDNRVFRTTNGGYNWNQIYITNYILDDMVFTDSLNGYLSGILSSGSILKSTNGGSIWNLVYSTNEEITKLKFPTFYVGYALGDSSRVFRTSNAGYNWFTQNLDSAYRYNDLSFVNEYTGFVVGQRGIVMRTTNGGSTYINPISTETPSKYSLSQNYPNPFNPTTNIKFSIVNSGDVKLVVYDIQGREVQTLVNESLKPGTYEAAFDGSALNSGVYFYKLITSTFSETKKMLLLK
ncbi:MAG: YCF48-related protein [Ignavibacteria bacterium]